MWGRPTGAGADAPHHLYLGVTRSAAQRRPLGDRIFLMTANVNGIRLSYSDTGTGIPALSLHGGMGIDSGSLRVPGILNLATHGIRLVIPDQRGHGQSSRGDPDGYSHAMWIADARELA